ncbi:hypothetical protein AAF712_016740 [Marasmius tenuissimus]|uniref:Uncharacterized protein n=1 Tax=Marasmius tenuissimus TaxID=585030 RepID=A0ABR2Z6U9_9AGAR
MVKIIPEAVVTARAFSAFTEALKEDHAEDLAAWEKLVTEWEQGQSRVCPYDVSEPTISMTKIRKDLAEEEHKRELAGQNTPSSTAAGTIIEGIEIEEAQQLLLHHLPFLRQILEADPITSDCTPKTLRLFLPSSLNSELRKLCPPDVMDIEERLPYAQAYDSLARLRAQLGARAVAYKRQSRVAPSQGNYTTTRALQDQIEVKVTASKMTYRSARDALMVLVGPGEWTDWLRELKDDNVRGITERLLKDNEKEELQRAQELAGYTVKEINEVHDAGNVPTAPLKRGVTLGQSSLSLSWIWYTHMPLVSGSDGTGKEGMRSNFQELQESLRAEWCKARACARRAREELSLVEEEMRRCIDYCIWQLEWWASQINRRTDIPTWLAEGLNAYAKEHQEVEKARASLWLTSWASVRERAKSVLRCLTDPNCEPMLQKLSELVVEVEMDDEEEQGIDIDHDNLFD